MRLLLSALLLASIGSAAPAPKLAPEPDASGLRDLTPGRYELKLGGVLCAACLRAAVAEFKKYPVVESAKTDVGGESVHLTISGKKPLKASEIKRALSRASGVANMGSKLSVVHVRYELAPINPVVPKTPVPASPK